MRILAGLSLLLAMFFMGCATTGCPDIVVGADGLFTRESLSSKLACMTRDTPADFGDNSRVVVFVP